MRLGRAGSLNAQSESQSFEGVCPASHRYSAMIEEAQGTKNGPFKAVARVQIPVGGTTKRAGVIIRRKVRFSSDGVLSYLGRVWDAS
jgi:hypothetical protein